MGAGPRSRGRRRRARRALGPTAPRPRSPHRDPRDARAGGGSVGGRRAVRPRADARSLPARPARAGARPAAYEAVPARFRPLRPAYRRVRGVSRNRAPAASASLLPPTARSGTSPLRRPHSLGRPPALALVRNRAMVRPRARQGDEAPLHRAAAPRLRPLGAPPGPLLPLRGLDARSLVRRRADVPRLPGRATVGGRADRPHRPDQQATDPARRRGRVLAPLDDELGLDHARRREEPVRGRPVAPRRLRLPRLPLRRAAALEDALALADPDRRALPARPVVRGRLHREPLHRRPADRLRLRRRGRLRRPLVLAPSRLARVEPRSCPWGRGRSGRVPVAATQQEASRLYDGSRMA